MSRLSTNRRVLLEMRNVFSAQVAEALTTDMVDAVAASYEYRIERPPKLPGENRAQYRARMKRERRA